MDTPEGAQNIEGLVIPAATSAPSGAGAATAGVSASAENIRQRKERKDKGQPRGPRGGESVASLQPLSATQFAKLYDPEIWQKAICAPADAMAAITAKPYWEVSQKEREAVGVTGSIAAQCFAVTDPRWLAASLAIITVLDVYGIRLALWMADLKKERQEELERKRAAQRG